MTKALNVSNLSLTIGKFCLLNLPQFIVEKGEIVCIAGHNGAGKTSFLRCITQQEKRYLGSIEVFENTQRTLVLQKIGAMLDPNALYNHLTAYENIDIIRRYYNFGRNVIEETLSLVALTEEKNKIVHYFSAGMKQRLSLGIAFIHRPELVLLDEPFNTLDPEAISNTRHLIKQLNQKYGTTFIITSHSLEEINKILTRLIIFKKGKIVFDANKQQLEDEKTAQQKNIEDIYLNINASE